jgi:hypothetical protein
MATRSKEWNAPVLVERGGREAVLAVISASPSVTIEELLHQLSWMRWGVLFAIIGECLQEGLVTLCQKEFQFEVRAIRPSQRGREENVQKGVVPSPSGDRRVAI